MTRLLAIDPGTNAMGLALFDGPDLVGSLLLKPPKGLSRARRDYLLEELAGWVASKSPIALAMERPGGKLTHLPPALLTLCLDIRQAAMREWGLPLFEYPPATITKAVAPRGWPGDRKAKLRAGVCALYGEKYRDAPQDVVDAIAVGFTHLAKATEREMELVEHG